jgi:hypothetical protein
MANGFIGYLGAVLSSLDRQFATETANRVGRVIRERGASDEAEDLRVRSCAAANPVIDLRDDQQVATAIIEQKRGSRRGQGVSTH